MTVEQATAALQEHFKVDVVEQPDESVPKGQVIESDPKGSAAPNSRVVLKVSSGPPLVVVPDVARGSYEQAAQKLSARGLGAEQVDAFDDTVPAGQVIRTQPAAGDSAPKRSNVQVIVSKGPDLVLVPDFKGKTVAEATALAGDAVALTPQGTLTPASRVRAQDPAAGTQVKRGTAVTIFF
jgi:beta-lactam-binding protein with PASTA domain